MHFQARIADIAPGQCQLWLDDVPVGDVLNDNAYREDGYRFHDLTHLAFLAHFGYSAVIAQLRTGNVPKTYCEAEEIASLLIYHAFFDRPPHTSAFCMLRLAFDACRPLSHPSASRQGFLGWCIAAYDIQKAWAFVREHRSVALRGTPGQLLVTGT